jgi:hypothetical protein
VETGWRGRSFAIDRAARQGVITSQTEQDRSSVLRGARERTRAEMTRQVLDAARQSRRRAAHRQTSAGKQASQSPIAEISTPPTRVLHGVFMQM